MVKSHHALSLLSLVMLCFVLSTQAAVLPARDLVAARTDPDFVARGNPSQHAFELAADQMNCNGGVTTTTSSSSTRITSSSSTKDAFSTVKAASTTSTSTATVTKAATTTTSTATQLATKTTNTVSLTTSTVASSVYTSSTTANNIVLTSNNASYGVSEVMADLNAMLVWAGDVGNVNTVQKQEIVAALLSASARYYPDLPTQVIVRIMLADIRQETDFNVAEISGARLDSGTSWGLLQVSPGDGSQELKLFQDHCNVVTHNFTYGMPDTIRANIKGPLLDYATGEMIDMASLTNDDLFRPWINIHVAMWIQSNLARSASRDPYDWTALNDASWSLKTTTTSGISTAVALKYQKLLAGTSGVAIDIRTALGSWVAGPAVDDGGYLTSGDDISLDYLNAIMRGVRALYGVSSAAAMPKAWLDTYTLYSGLIDYV